MDKTVSLTGFSWSARLLILERLERFIEEELGFEDDLAYDEFHAGFSPEDLDDIPPEFLQICNDLYDQWFVFDRPLPSGLYPVDLFIQQTPDITVQEYAYLRSVKETSLSLYRVEDLLPGISLTLRDLLDGSQVTVMERQGSRNLTRHTVVAARINPQGASGHAEIERICVHIPSLLEPHMLEAIHHGMSGLRQSNPHLGLRQALKDLTPVIHQVWLLNLLKPALPQLLNTDGEILLGTRIRFEVRDSARLMDALTGIPELQADPASDRVWHWSGTGGQGHVVSLGRLELQGATLVLEVNSAERGARGRQLIEDHAGDAVRHRATSHENMEALIRDGIREGMRASGGSADVLPPEQEAIPREVIEELTLDHYARHYRQWLDDSLPALQGKTPREAARSNALRPALIGLIQQLEHHYEGALKTGEPAYDPSWMWQELDLKRDKGATRLPPPAHQRLARMCDGFDALCSQLALETRQRYDTGRQQNAPARRSAVLTPQLPLLSESTLGDNLAVRRFLSRLPFSAPADGGGARQSPEWTTMLGAICQVANFKVHLQKTFLVDPTANLR